MVCVSCQNIINPALSIRHMKDGKRWKNMTDKLTKIDKDTLEIEETKVSKNQVSKQEIEDRLAHHQKRVLEEQAKLDALK